jgi:hypothetical protein
VTAKAAKNAKFGARQTLGNQLIRWSMRRDIVLGFAPPFLFANAKRARLEDF